MAPTVTRRRRVVIGGYSKADLPQPGGLGLFGNDGDVGWRLLDRLDLVNPTFGVFDPDRRVLYTSHSGQDYLSAVALGDDDGHLRLLGHAPTGSVNPAHLALSPDRRFLVAASFTSGHVSVVGVRDTGQLDDLVEAIPTTGATGPLRAQSGSQPHQVVFGPEGTHVFVPDRGCDRILVYRFDSSSGSLALVAESTARPGAGPRHLLFADAETAWVVNELDNTLASYRWDATAETLSPIAVRSTLPEDYGGESAGGGIAAGRDHRLLYVSNRGHDSVATFASSDDGAAVCIGWTPVGGRTPRFLGVDPATGDLWVTGQDSDRVQRFVPDPVSGLPRFTETVAFGAPACVVFV
jgi:6-phosphogluconolactonase (cycloisomerase 2 family)